MNAASAAASAAAHPANDIERAAIIAAARAPAESDLKVPLRLAIGQLAVAGEWAFVLANMQDANGQPLDFSKTSRAGEAKEGVISHRLAVLLKRADARWTVLAIRVGPTDPAWLSWADEYGAPASLFASPD